MFFMYHWIFVFFFSIFCVLVCCAVSNKWKRLTTDFHVYIKTCIYCNENWYEWNKYRSKKLCMKKNMKYKKNSKWVLELFWAAVSCETKLNAKKLISVTFFHFSSIVCGRNSPLLLWGKILFFFFFIIFIH